MILRIRFNEILSHTLDKQKDGIMNISLPDIAAELQTLAEKMSNTIYRAAKVCSFTARYLANNQIHTPFHPSVYLMYEIGII